jgi:hypothetical protein
MRVACLLLLLVAVQARAELVNHGTYTTDTVSNLDWMNSSLTLGMTYQQALQKGWRHASRAEVDALAKRYIGTAEGKYSVGQDFNQTLRVIALLGVTLENLAGDDSPVKFATMGYYNDGLTTDGVGLGEFSVFLFVPTDPGDPIYPDLFVARWITLDNAFSTQTATTLIANFMVRRRIP